MPPSWTFSSSFLRVSLVLSKLVVAGMDRLSHTCSEAREEEWGGLCRRLLLRRCGLEGPRDGRCALLDAFAGCLDPGDGLLAATGPGCDVPEGVVAAVDPKRLAGDVCRGLGLKLGKRPVLVTLMVESVRDLFSARVFTRWAGVFRVSTRMRCRS